MILYHYDMFHWGSLLFNEGKWINSDVSEKGRGGTERSGWRESFGLDVLYERRTH